MNRRHLTLRQLEIFACVARMRSFTRAAEALHLTQPAVSIQIQRLAETVGMPLFDIVARDVRLTEVGRALLETTDLLDDAWDRFEAAIGAHGRLEHGRLRIASVTTAEYFLPRMLGNFCRRYPGIEIELEVLNRERVLARLREGLDDLYVMALPPEDMDLVTHPFLENQLVIIAPLDFPLAAQGQLTLADLTPYRFIMRETGSGTRRIADAHFAACGVSPSIKLSLGSNEAIREAVAGGMGLAILSRHALPAQPADADVRVLEVNGFPLRRHWYLAHPRGRHLSLPAQAFIDEVLAAPAAPADAAAPRKAPRRRTQQGAAKRVLPDRQKA